MPSFCELRYVSVHPTAALRSQQRGDPWLISAKNCEPIPFIRRNYVVSGKMGNLCHVQGQVGSETTKIHQDGVSWLSQGCKSGGSPSTSASGSTCWWHQGDICSFIPAQAGKRGGSPTLSQRSKSWLFFSIMHRCFYLQAGWHCG